MTGEIMTFREFKIRINNYRKDLQRIRRESKENAKALRQQLERQYYEMSSIQLYESGYDIRVKEAEEAEKEDEFLNGCIDTIDWVVDLMKEVENEQKQKKTKP